MANSNINTGVNSLPNRIKFNGCLSIDVNGKWINDINTPRATAKNIWAAAIASAKDGAKVEGVNEVIISVHLNTLYVGMVIAGKAEELARVDNLPWDMERHDFPHQGSGVFGKTALFATWEEAVFATIEALTDYLRENAPTPPETPPAKDFEKTQQGANKAANPTIKESLHVRKSRTTQTSYCRRRQYDSRVRRQTNDKRNDKQNDKRPPLSINGLGIYRDKRTDKQSDKQTTSNSPPIGSP